MKRRTDHRLEASLRRFLEDPRLSKFALNLTDGDREDAADLINEAVARTLRAVPDIAPDVLGPYVLVTMRRAATEVWGRRAKAATPVDDIEASLPPDPVDSIARAVDRVLLGDILSILTPNQRQAFVLTAVKGLTLQEAGQVLGIRGQSVEKLLTRARRSVARQFNGEMGR